MKSFKDWDKWDYFEVFFRAGVFIGIFLSSAYFVIQVSEVIVGLLPDQHFIQYFIVALMILAFIFLNLASLVWILMIAKGTWRPVEELPEDGEQLEDIT